MQGNAPTRLQSDGFDCTKQEQTEWNWTKTVDWMIVRLNRD